MARTRGSKNSSMRISIRETSIRRVSNIRIHLWQAHSTKRNLKLDCLNSVSEYKVEFRTVMDNYTPNLEHLVEEVQVSSLLVNLIAKNLGRK